MSDAVIDVTRRARIRALAVRMHRAGIAGAFSIGGGAPDIDESALTDSQRSEAAKILEEQSAASVDIKDVETAASVAMIIPRHVKPSCSTCHGGGVASRSGVDDICDCVDRRWQAAVDHQAFVDGLHAPGRASGVRVKSTRAADDAKRLAAARAILLRARAAVSAACADIDVKINALEGEVAVYLAERAKLDARRAEAGMLAEEHEHLADGLGKASVDARSRAEEIALRLGDLVAPLFQFRPSRSFDDDRSLARTTLDEVFAAAMVADTLYIDTQHALGIARDARVVEQLCEQRITDIDTGSAELVDKTAKLRSERTRIARHYQPKADRAERRVRRLVYLAGDAAVALVEPQGGSRPQGGSKP